MDAVQRSCRAVADRPVALAEAFYRHLFALVPEIREMFADDMTDQMQRMTDTLLAAISRLTTDDTAELEVLLVRMGAAHYRHYGVQPAQYVYVGHALTRAIREVASLDYDSYLSSCWVALTKWVTARMIGGARQAIAEERRPRGSVRHPGIKAERPVSHAAE